MTNHYQPKYPWQPPQHPRPQQSHLWSLHHLLVDAVLHFDHVEEVEDNGYAYSGKVDSREHQGGPVTFFMIEAVQVSQFESEEGVIGHIDDECYDQKDHYSYHLKIIKEKKIAQQRGLMGQKDLAFTEQHYQRAQPEKNRKYSISLWANFAVPPALDQIGLFNQRPQSTARLPRFLDILKEHSLIDIVVKLLLLASATSDGPLHQSVMLDGAFEAHWVGGKVISSSDYFFKVGLHNRLEIGWNLFLGSVAVAQDSWILGVLPDVSDIGCHLLKLFFCVFNFFFHLTDLLVQVSQVIRRLCVPPHRLRDLHQRISQQDHQQQHAPYRRYALQEYDESHVFADAQQENDQECYQRNAEQDKIKNSVYFKATFESVKALQIAGIFPFLQDRDDSPGEYVYKPVEDEVLVAQGTILGWVGLSIQGDVDIFWHKERESEVENPCNDGPQAYVPRDVLAGVIVDQIDTVEGEEAEYEKHQHSDYYLSLILTQIIKSLRIP